MSNNENIICGLRHFGLRTIFFQEHSYGPRQGLGVYLDYGICLKDGVCGLIWNYVVEYCLLSWRYNPLWLYFHSPVVCFSLLVFRGFLIIHNDAPQSVVLLWTSDKSVSETSTWQHTTLTTDKHPCRGGIRTHNLSRRAAEDLRLRPRGYWDRRGGILLLF